MSRNQATASQMVGNFPPAVGVSKSSQRRPTTATATNRSNQSVPPRDRTAQSQPKDKLLEYIHHFVEGKKASDAHDILDGLIKSLNNEDEEIQELPQDDEILLANPETVPIIRKTRQVAQAGVAEPATLRMPATLKLPDPTASLATAAAQPMFANVVPAAPIVDLSFLRQLQQQATITQTVYVRAGTTTITATVSATGSSDSNGSQKGNKYMDEGGSRDSSVPVIAMLAVFGAILVIGPLLAYCWWRSRKRAEKENTLPYFGRDMESRHRYPPEVGGYSSYHNVNRDVVTEPRDSPQRHMAADAFEPSSSRRPSTAPSVTRKQSKFKGKAHKLPPINTSGVPSSEPPISPTFVPLPGTPMKLVPREQVLSDPQRRRGVDALDLAAQRESNYKHWKAIKSDENTKSITQPKSAEVPNEVNHQHKTKEYVKKLVDESRNHPEKPSSISKNVAELQRNTKESALQPQPIELENIPLTSHHYLDRNDTPSDVSAARLMLQSVE